MSDLFVLHISQIPTLALSLQADQSSNALLRVMENSRDVISNDGRESELQQYIF